MLSLLPLSPPAASYTFLHPLVVSPGLSPHRASEEQRANLSRVDPLLALAVSGALLDGHALSRIRSVSGVPLVSPNPEYITIRTWIFEV